MNKYLKVLILLIFIIYIGCYYISEKGYYEYKLQEKTILTNQRIREFEEDVKDNKDLDIKDYLRDNEIDYTNKFSDIVYNISNKSNNFTKRILKKIFKKLSYLVLDS